MREEAEGSWRKPARAEPKERWLIVRLAGVEFALPAEPVREMMQLRGLPLTSMAPCGLFRFKTRLNATWLPVGLPHEPLRLRARPVNARSCLLVVERAAPHAFPLRYGIIIDSVSRDEQFARCELQTRHPETGRPFPLALGRLRWNEKWHLALDLEALFPARDVLEANQAPTAA